jgi:hypothetical protein
MLTKLDKFTRYGFAMFCKELADTGRLFHFDDRQEIVYEGAFTLSGGRTLLFTPEEQEIVMHNLSLADEAGHDVHTYALLAMNGRDALTAELGSEHQIDAENRFFMELEDLGVDMTDGGELATYCLKATTEEMIATGYEALKTLDEIEAVDANFITPDDEELILVECETRFFSFVGVFRSKEDAYAEWLRAWKRHTKRGGDPNYGKQLWEEGSVIGMKIKIGKIYCDHSEC